MFYASELYLNDIHDKSNGNYSLDLDESQCTPMSMSMETNAKNATSAVYDFFGETFQISFLFSLVLI